MKHLIQNSFFAASKLRSTFSILTILTCLLSWHIAALAQASQTTVSQIGSSNTYALSFQQDPNNPVDLLGVAFNIVVSGSSPTIELIVPEDSWLFEVGSTDLEVGTPTVTGTTYTFPISAWRQDNNAQGGSGTYLHVKVDGGVIIAVEDFPSKSNDSSLVDQNEKPERTLDWMLDTSIRCDIYNVQNQFVATLNGSTMTENFRGFWQSARPGIYLLHFQRRDGSTSSLKMFKS